MRWFTRGDLDGFFGLHPGLAPLRDLFSEGILALHPTIGNAQLTRSHFDPQDFMHTAAPGDNSAHDAWLERVARQHEAVLEATLTTSTIVPLRMCTIYETAESVRRMLEREHESFVESLGVLDGRLEWAVKVLVNRETLMQSARRGAEASSPGQSPAGRGEGGAYMLQRRRDRAAREAVDAMAAEVAEQVHARLQDWAIDATTRPPQNRELSGHQGDMLLNAAYLVERERSEELRRLVAGLEDHHRELGVRIELTGPWPPYNFVPGGSAAALG